MIKIQNNIATREPIPAFLIGLAPESLADLSWTDPALGVSEATWWPEVDQSPVLGEYERYGAETLTVDADNKQVIVVRAVEPWSDEEIAADKKAKVPQSVTIRQAIRALFNAGLLDDVEAIVAQADRPTQIDWERATEFRRDWPTLITLQAVLGLTDDQVDQLFIEAAKL